MTDLIEIKQQLTPRGQEILEKTIERKGEDWVLENKDLVLAQASKVGHRIEPSIVFSEEKIERYQRIIDFLLPPDGTPTSTAKLEKELEGDSEAIDKAVRDLIAFGELELINTSQYGRVRLHQPAIKTNEQTTFGDATNHVWLAYITEQTGLGRIRARRMFDNREAGEKHLKQIANIETLTPVPDIPNLWCAALEGAHNPEYGVLRKDVVFQQADDPYP